MIKRDDQGHNIIDGQPLDVGLVWTNKMVFAAGAVVGAAPTLAYVVLSSTSPKHATEPAITPDPAVLPATTSPLTSLGRGLTIKARAGDTPWRIAGFYGAQSRPHWWAELKAANPHKALTKTGKGWKVLLVGDDVVLPAAWFTTRVNGVGGLVVGDFLDDAAKWINDATTETVGPQVPAAPSPDAPPKHFVASLDTPGSGPPMAPGDPKQFSAHASAPTKPAAAAAPRAAAPGSSGGGAKKMQLTPQGPVTAPAAHPAASPAAAAVAAHVSHVELSKPDSPAGDDGGSFAGQALGAGAVLAFAGAAVVGVMALASAVSPSRE